jgi:hypothetical protein
MLKINSLNYKDWLIASVLFTLTILSSLHYYTIFLLHLDEGIALYGAKRIILGQILYKDFFDIVTPGTDYLLAGVFKIFGTTLKAARITTIVANALNVTMLYLTSNSLIKNRKIALIPPILLMMIYITNVDYYVVSHHWFAITAAIFTLLLSMKSEKGKLNWFFPGIGSFLVFIFMQSTGFILYGMLVLFLFIKIFLNKDKHRDVLHDLIYYSLGFWIPIVIVFLLFFINGGLRDFIYDIFIFPLKHYKVTNNGSYVSVIYNANLLQMLHYPFFERITLPIIWYFPPVFIILGTVGIIKEYLKDKVINYHIVLLLLLLLAFFISELLNPDIQRFVVYLPVFLIIIFSALLKRFKGAFYAFSKAVYMVYMIGGIVFIGYFCITEFQYTNFIGKHSIRIKSAAGEIRIANNGQVIEPAILSLLDILNQEHPKDLFIFYWSPILYFISGINNPTILNTYTPLYNTQTQEDRVIQQLKSSKPKFIIKDPYLNLLHYETWRNVNPGVFDPSNDKILQYVNQHYVVDKELYGVYTIYKLKD